jgi:Spy/CpxP family protein refolding chaperone
MIMTGFKSIALGALTLCLFAASAPAQAQTLHHGNHAAPATANPYQGQQNRAITSLSSEDVQALQNGEGWGLAKPAEFNGVPGPAHLLELADEIGLSEQQKQQVTKLFDDMKAQAIALGNEYIASEKAIDDYFRSGQFSDRLLRERVDQAEQNRANLRFLHLSYHHKTLDVVTPEQIAQYNALRGYDQMLDDPCSNIPEGHNPAMFRKHMGCD